MPAKQAPLHLQAFVCDSFGSALARRILYKPIEVVVGEKGRTAAKVQQYVEVMDEERKFYRYSQNEVTVACGAARTP